MAYDLDTTSGKKLGKRPPRGQPKPPRKSTGRGRTAVGVGEVPPERVNINIREIPRDLRDQFKAWCATRGMAMNKVIVTYMKKCVRDPHSLDLS
jgi:hypothetical protein